MRKKLLLNNFITSFFTLVLLAFMAAPVSIAEENEAINPFARFGNYTEGSDLAIEHRVWNDLLGVTVIVIRPSSRTMASTQNSPKTGTRISRGSRSPARLEGNRVLFHLLDEGHVTLVAKYRHELEKLPDFFPLAEFNKDEQLAFWLNLHNAILFEQMAQRYPFSKLKKLRNGRKNIPSLWDEKLANVEGVALSLNDIQNNILIRHWKSPMVLYGLWQGAIGGPSLPDRAFSGANVHNLLKRAAEEFVNSNRGVRMRGNQARVSMVYEWGKAAFPDWENDLASHLRGFAKPNLSDDLANSDEFSATLYDWSIADTKGGTLSAGPKLSTAANLLTMGPNDTVSAADFAFIGEDNTASLVSRKGGLSQMLTDMYRNGLIVPGALDAETAKLLKEMARIADETGTPEGIVTSEECGTGECPPDLPDDDPGPDGDRE